MNATDRVGWGGRLIGQMTRYQWFVRWFIWDLLRNYKRRALYVAAGNFLGVSGQVAAFSLAYMYARAIEKGGIIERFGYSVAPRESLAGLLLVALAATFLLVGSALLSWHARVLSNDLARRYADDCARRVLVHASGITGCANRAQAEALRSEKLSRYASRDARYNGLTARLLLNGLDGILGAFAGAAALVYLDAASSSLIGLILAIAAIFYYRVSVNGANIRSVLERKARQSGRERMRLNRRVQNVAAAIPPNDKDLIDIFEHGATHLSGLAFANVRNVIVTSALITQIAAAAAILVIFVSMGVKAFAAQSGWTELIAYLVALKYFTSKLTTASRIVVSINRFYPAIREYANFVVVAKRLRHQPISRPQDEVRFVLNKEPLTGGGGPLEIRQGDRCWLALPEKPSRSQLLALVGELAMNGDGPNRGVPSLWFVRGDVDPSATGFRDLFGLPHQLTVQELRKCMADLGVGDSVELPRDLDAPFTAGVNRRLGEAGVGAVALTVAMLNAAEVVVIEHDVLDILGPGIAEKALDRLGDRIVLLATAGLEAIAAGQEAKAAVFFDGKRILGWVLSSALPLDSKLAAELSANLAGARRKADTEGVSDYEEEILGY